MKVNSKLVLKLKSIKLKYRMFLIYIVGGVIPMLIVNAYLNQSTKNIILNHTREAEVAELTLIKDNILENMRIVTDISKLMYFDEKLEHIAFNQYQWYEEVVEDYRNYTTMADYQDYYNQVIQGISMYLENNTISENSRFLIVDDKIQEEKWYQDTLKESGRVVWSYKYNNVQKENYLCLSRLIRTIDGKNVGVLAINMNKERTDHLVRKRDKESIILINQNEIVSTNRKTSSKEEVIKLLSDFREDIAYGKVTYMGQDCFLTVINFHTPSSYDRITLLSLQPYNELMKEVNAQSKGSVNFIIASFLLSFVLITIFSIRFSRRVNCFKNQMHKAASGDFNIASNIGGHDEISELYNDLNRMIESIQHLLTTVYEEKVQKEKLNSRQKDVEFKMLASQINPHFLYNTLETIRMKARTNGEAEIEDIVKMLAKIMRRNIQVGDTLVTLKSEIELVEYYLKIQQMRFGERIKFNIEFKCDIDGLKIIPLIIQPIVENAFVHGLEIKEGVGNIDIMLEKTDRLRIFCIDDGVGIPEEQLIEIKTNLNDFSNLDRTHIGLSNVNQRIKLLYGEQYGILIDSELNKGTTVIIELPGDLRP